MNNGAAQWQIFRASGEPHDGLTKLSLPPPWRRSSLQEWPRKPEKPRFDLESEAARGAPISVNKEVRQAINAALCLRRPLLITGKPGTGKSSVISAVAYELRMGPVLRWPIGSRSTVKNSLYEYDAVGRLQAQQMRGEPADIGDFVRLGPLGTALYPTSWPRALLIDEIDKGDLDLPNDLLDLLEEGQFEIPEIARYAGDVTRVRLHDSVERVEIRHGRVTCSQFPFVVMTSNGEREFPGPFLRRCIRVKMPQPTKGELGQIVDAHLRDHLNATSRAEIDALIDDFLGKRATQDLATDQLLNAVFVVLGDGRHIADPNERAEVVALLLKQLATTQAT